MNRLSYAQELLDQLHASHPMARKPVIAWRNFRVAAGKAYFTTNVIGLSLQLLDTEERIRITLVHEYAHLLAVDRHGRRAANHGPLWQKAMRDLGAEPKRTHSYAVAPPIQSKAVTYRCDKCGHEIVRKRRLPQGRLYVHAVCGGGLTFIAEARVINLPSPT